MEVNKNCILLFFFSLSLLFALLGATHEAQFRSLQPAPAINDSGKEINLATNFTQIEKLSDEGNDGHGPMKRALSETSKTTNKKSVSKKSKKKKKKKKKRNAATTARGTPSLALLVSTSLLGFAALLAC